MLNPTQAYETGEGTEANFEEAMKWFRASADQGYSWSQYKLGRIYDYGEGVEVDKECAMSWYRKAMEQENAWAINNLGKMYENGETMDVDLKTAVEYYRIAAGLFLTFCRYSKRHREKF